MQGLNHPRRNIHNIIFIHAELWHKADNAAGCRFNFSVAAKRRFYYIKALVHFLHLRAFADNARVQHAVVQN